MVLVKRQTKRLMKQNRKAENTKYDEIMAYTVEGEGIQYSVNNVGKFG